MFRKLVIICTAIAAVIGGAIAVPTAASARGGWGGGRGGWGRGGWGYRGGGFYRGAGIGLGLGVVGAGVYGGYPYYGGGYPYYGGGCWRYRTVYTPYGPRARRFWVCG